MQSWTRILDPVQARVWSEFLVLQVGLDTCILDIVLESNVVYDNQHSFKTLNKYLNDEITRDSVEQIITTLQSPIIISLTRSSGSKSATKKQK